MMQEALMKKDPKTISVLWMSDDYNWNCYDENTEVLTDQGWLYFNQVTKNCKVCSLNPETHEIEYLVPTKIIWQEYSGKMYCLANQQVNLVVTPDHKMYIGKKNKAGKLVYRIQEAKKGYAIKRNHYLKSGHWTGEVKNTVYTGGILGESPVIPFLNFMGYYLSEGCVVNSGKTKRIEIRQMNTEKRDLMWNKIQGISSYKITKYSRGIRIYDPVLYNYLSQFGKTHEKYVPNCIKELSPSLLKIFWDAYRLGDGESSPGSSNRIFTCSTRIRDDLQEIALKMGGSANYRIRTRKGDVTYLGERKIIANYDLYELSYISIRNRPQVNSQKQQDSWVEYEGHIGCVHLPKNHIMYVRREGKPVWSGNTGYAKCCREILTRLVRMAPEQTGGYKFEINHVAKFARGESYMVHGLNFGVHPFTGQYGDILLPLQLQAIQPDILVSQDDTFVMTRNHLHELNYGNTKFVPYAAIDGEPIATDGHPPLKKAHTIVAMSEFGRKVMENEGYTGIKTIYHGVDLRKYTPTNAKEEIRDKIGPFYSKLWGKDISFKDKYLMLAVGRNSIRKNFCQLLDAFALFQHEKPDACLLIHCNNFQAEDLNLMDYIERDLPYKFGKKAKNLLWNKIYFSPTQDLSRGLPEQDLIRLIQMSDTCITAALGEGFGMVLLESMACGVPVISNGYSTPKELLIDETTALDGRKIGQRGLISESGELLAGNFNICHRHPVTSSFVEQMDTLYSDWHGKNKLYQEFIKNGLLFAQKYDWNNVVKQWADLFIRLKNPAKYTRVQI
jgi:glycosyltransferase involved in cell wall biosynthesis